MIFIGLLIFILGAYLYFRIIRRDKVGVHKNLMQFIRLVETCLFMLYY